MFTFKVIYFLLPELVTISILIFLLLTFTILNQPHNALSIKKYPNLLNSILTSLFLTLLFYFFLILFSEKNFNLTCGLQLTAFIYLIKLFLGFLFILYFLYLWSTISYDPYPFEFYFVIIFSFISLNFLLMSTTLMNIFIFIELFGLTTYYLISSKKKSFRTIESTIKYFVFGSISSSFLLLGIFMIYFSTGLSNFFEFSMFLTNKSINFTSNKLLIIGFLFVIISIISKIGGSFYFFWMSDLYEGISSPTFIFLTIFPKIIYITLIFFFLYFINIYFITIFIKYLLLITLIFGFFGSLFQTKLKRLLITLSIFNISFFSLILWDQFLLNQAFFLFFFFFYLLNSFALLIIIFSLKNWSNNKHITNISDLTNLHSQNPRLAMLLSAILFISSGLPPSLLFISKFSIFFVTGQSLGLFLLLFFLLFSTLNFFIYIRLIRLIYTSRKNSNILFAPLNFTVSFLISFISLLNLFFILFFDKILLFLQYFLIFY